MSLKFILLLLTTFLLVHSSFGRHAPAESSENELAPTDSKDNEDSSNENQHPEYYLKQRKFIVQSIRDVFDGVEALTEEESPLKFGAKVSQKLERNYYRFWLSLSFEERLLSNGETLESVIALIQNLYQSPKTSDSEESFDDEVLTVKDKKRIFLVQHIVNYAYLAYSFKKGYIDEKEFHVTVVDSYKEAVKEFYNSFTKEEQEMKKPYLDLVEKQTVETLYNNKEITDEEYDKKFALFSQFFELTDAEKFKCLVIYNAKRQLTDITDFIDFYKDQVEKYYDSLPNEKSKLKKKFADHLEKLNSTDSFGKQIKQIIIWMLTLKDDEE